MWKEPELVREAEGFRLDIVGLTSTHGLGSGTSPLESWTLFHTGVARGERCRAGVGIFIAPPAVCMYIYPSGREGSLPPPSGGGTGPDCCLCLCAKHQLMGTDRPSGLQPWRLLRRKLGPGRSSVRPWRMTSGRPRRDSGPPFSVSGGEAAHSQHCVWWGRSFADLN